MRWEGKWIWSLVQLSCMRSAPGTLHLLHCLQTSAVLLPPLPLSQLCMFLYCPVAALLAKSCVLPCWRPYPRHPLCMSSLRNCPTAGQLDASQLARILVLAYCPLAVRLDVLGLIDLCVVPPGPCLVTCRPTHMSSQTTMHTW